MTSSFIYAIEALENDYLATAYSDGKIKIYDILNGTLKFTFDKSVGGHSKDVKSLVLMDNGYLASGSEDCTIKIMDLKENN